MFYILLRNILIISQITAQQCWDNTEYIIHSYRKQTIDSCQDLLHAIEQPSQSCVTLSTAVIMDHTIGQPSSWVTLSNSRHLGSHYRKAVILCHTIEQLPKSCVTLSNSYHLSSHSTTAVVLGNTLEQLSKSCITLSNSCHLGLHYQTDVKFLGHTLEQLSSWVTMLLHHTTTWASLRDAAAATVQ